MQLMSMLPLINNKIKKARMQKVLIIFIMLYLYTGCSKLESVVLAQSIENKQLSCSKIAKPKSLQLLEQQYRCTSQE